MRAPISEEFSEKTKRGRPRLLSKMMEGCLRQSTVKYDVDRTLQNRNYMSRAESVLGFLSDDLSWDHSFVWLWDLDACRQNRKGTHRRTILAELGRISDKHELIAVARRICELKPTAREATAMIRHFRLGEPPENIDSLGKTLTVAIDAYLTRYPSTSKEAILRAIRETHQAVILAMGDVDSGAYFQASTDIG